MGWIRLILFLALLTGLSGLLLSNGGPALPLVFLGIPTIPLPLGLWLLAAFGAGVAVALWWMALLRLAVGSSARRAPGRWGRGDDRDFAEEDFVSEFRVQPPAQGTSRGNEEWDNWDAASAGSRPPAPSAYGSDRGGGVGRRESIYDIPENAEPAQPAPEPVPASDRPEPLKPEKLTIDPSRQVVEPDFASDFEPDFASDFEPDFAPASERRPPLPRRTAAPRVDPKAVYDADYRVVRPPRSGVRQEPDPEGFPEPRSNRSRAPMDPPPQRSTRSSSDDWLDDGEDDW